MTCDTCPYWKKGLHGNQCDYATYSDEPSASPKLFEVFGESSDDHGLSVVLLTGPKFGCVHHPEFMVTPPVKA